MLVRRAFGLADEAPAAVVAHPSELADTYVLHVRLLTWDGPRLEIVGLLTHDDISHVTWVDHDDAGRPVRFATAGVPYNDLGKGWELAWCEWDGDRCVRVRHRSSDVRERAYEAEYDEQGLLQVVDDDETVHWLRRLHAVEDDPLAPDAALAAWVEAVAEAAVRVVQRVEASDPAVIKVAPRFADDNPHVVVAGRAYLEAAAALGEAREAILRLWEPRHELALDLDEAGLRALRSLRQQQVPDDEQPAVAEALMRRLAEMRWPGDAIPVVSGLGADPWQLAARVLPQRIAGLQGALPAAVPRPAVEHPPRSVAELADLLAVFGLPRDLAAQAAWGLALTGGGRGRSRLGGRAELPEGMPWPTSDDRALTHLATIDLSELPDFDGRDLLPADGDLAFFADLTEEGELWEPVVAGEDDRVRILHVVPGTPTHEPEPPRDERDEYDSREPGQVSVLHVGWDEALRFEFLDGGDLTFYGDADDVRAGRWDRLTVSPESC